MCSIVCNVFNPSMREFVSGVPISLQCLSHRTAPFVSQTTSEASGCGWELSEYMQGLANNAVVVWRVVFGITEYYGDVPPHQPMLIYMQNGERFIVTLEFRTDGDKFYFTLASTRVTPAGPYPRSNMPVQIHLRPGMSFSQLEYERPRQPETESAVLPRTNTPLVGRTVLRQLPSIENLSLPPTGMPNDAVYDTALQPANRRPQEQRWRTPPIPSSSTRDPPYSVRAQRQQHLQDPRAGLGAARHTMPTVANLLTPFPSVPTIKREAFDCDTNTSQLTSNSREESSEKSVHEEPGSSVQAPSGEFGAMPNAREFTWVREQIPQKLRGHQAMARQAPFPSSVLETSQDAVSSRTSQEHDTSMPPAPHPSPQNETGDSVQVPEDAEGRSLTQPGDDTVREIRNIFGLHVPARTRSSAAVREETDSPPERTVLAQDEGAVPMDVDDPRLAAATCESNDSQGDEYIVVNPKAMNRFGRRQAKRSKREI